jgi:hypothetical protein
MWIYRNERAGAYVFPAATLWSARAALRGGGPVSAQDVPVAPAVPRMARLGRRAGVAKQGSGSTTQEQRGRLSSGSYSKAHHNPEQPTSFLTL